MRITTLIENKPSKTNANLSAEWGLSLHIEFNGHGILFDTGASAAFVKNAELLSVDLSSIATAVLSHHHFDHGGGLRRFLEVNPAAKVYLGQAPQGDCYGKAFGFLQKYIGLDKTLRVDARFVTVREPVEILPDVFLLPNTVFNHSRPAGNKNLFVKKEHRFELDDFAHEIIMAIKEEGKLVVFTGCSHNGVLNMIDTVSAMFAEIPVKAVIGGFHFVAMPLINLLVEDKAAIEKVARSMLDYPVGITYTGHCTAPKAFKILQSVMGNRIQELETGSCFLVP